MIIVMRAKAEAQEIQKVSEKIAELGFKPHVIKGIERTVIGAIGDNRFKERLKTLVSRLVARKRFCKYSRKEYYDFQVKLSKIG